jgi:hypothetical protein
MNRFLTLIALTFVFSGCGSIADAPSVDGDADAPASAETGGQGDADALTTPDGALESGTPDGSIDGSITRDARPVEPLPDTSLPDVTQLPDACPPAVQPARPCDSLKQTGCPAGQACIDYPQTETSGDPACSGYLWGTQCVAAGTGTQWAACSGNSCAPGYECWGVRGTLVCLKLCDTAGANGCPPGLACDPLFLGTATGICE